MRSNLLCSKGLRALFVVTSLALTTLSAVAQGWQWPGQQPSPPVWSPPATVETGYGTQGYPGHQGYQGHQSYQGHQGRSSRVGMHLEWCARDFGAFEGANLAAALLAASGRQWGGPPSQRAALTRLAIRLVNEDAELAFGLMLSCQAHNPEAQAAFLLNRHQVISWLNRRGNSRGW